MALFDLTLHTRTSLLVDGEPRSLVFEHYGEIVCIEKDGDVESVAGHVRAQRLHADLTANRGERLFDVCDGHSQEMCDLHALL